MAYVKITWTTADTDASSFTVQRSGNGTDWVFVVNVSPNVTSWVDNNPANGGWWYRVGAVGTSETVWSEPMYVEFDCRTEPPPVTCVFSGIPGMANGGQNVITYNVVAPSLDEANGKFVFAGLSYGSRPIATGKILKMDSNTTAETWVDITPSNDVISPFRYSIYSANAEKVFFRRERKYISVFNCADDTHEEIELPDPNDNAWAERDDSLGIVEVGTKIYALCSSGGVSVIHRIDPVTLTIEATSLGDFRYIDRLCLNSADGMIYGAQATGDVVGIDPQTMVEVSRTSVKDANDAQFYPFDICYIPENESVFVTGGTWGGGDDIEGTYRPYKQRSPGGVFIQNDSECQFTSDYDDTGLYYWSFCSYSTAASSLIVSGLQVRQFKYPTMLYVRWSANAMHYGHALNNNFVFGCVPETLELGPVRNAVPLA